MLSVFNTKGLKRGNYAKLRGSSLFSVELDLGEAEFAGDKVKLGDQVGGGTIAGSLAVGGTKDTMSLSMKALVTPHFQCARMLLKCCSTICESLTM